VSGSLAHISQPGCATQNGGASMAVRPAGAVPARRVVRAECPGGSCGQSRCRLRHRDGVPRRLQHRCRRPAGVLRGPRCDSPFAQTYGPETITSLDSLSRQQLAELNYVLDRWGQSGDPNITAAVALHVWSVTSAGTYNSHGMSGDDYYVARGRLRRSGARSSRTSPRCGRKPPSTRSPTRHCR
jgi:hypothetical protein